VTRVRHTAARTIGGGAKNWVSRAMKVIAAMAGLAALRGMGTGQRLASFPPESNRARNHPARPRNR
jgi:hypothetical protein